MDVFHNTQIQQKEKRKKEIKTPGFSDMQLISALKVTSVGSSYSFQSQTGFLWPAGVILSLRTNKGGKNGVQSDLGLEEAECPWSI